MMATREEKELAGLEKNLAIPKWKYIVSNGLAWGLSVSLILLLIDWVINGKSPSVQWSEGYWANLLIMPFGGLLYGWLVRGMLERRYRKLKGRQPQ